MVEEQVGKRKNVYIKMKDNLNNLIINENVTILYALKLLEKNDKGFLIVTDELQKVVAVVTDEDIRRHLIKGYSIEGNISNVCTETYMRIYDDDDTSKMIDVFKGSSKKVLVITDHHNTFVNVITRDQLQRLLLQDCLIDMHDDFMSMDESITEYEIHQRPWGFYKTTIYNSYFLSKILFIKPGGQLRLQLHKHREEYWVIVHGCGKLHIDESERNVICGDTVFIPKGARHRIININKIETLVISEVQIGDYLSEDDIVRIEDIYGRK